MELGGGGVDGNPDLFAGHVAGLLDGLDGALDLLQAFAFDVLVTDFAMPEMSGAQLAEAAQTGWPGLPILLVSGYAELPEGTAADLPKLAKPFRQDQLLRCVAFAVAANQPAGEVLKFPGRKQR